MRRILFSQMPGIYSGVVASVVIACFEAVLSTKLPAQQPHDERAPLGGRVAFGLGSTADPNLLDRQLAAGEYTLALAGVSASSPSSAAGHSSSPNANEALSANRISEHRRQAELSGLGLGLRRPSRSSDDGYRSLSGTANGTGGQPQGLGSSGGQVQADFDTLIQLIQTVVEPDSWEENGGTGTIATFQNGVLIDVAGQLRFAGPAKQKSNLLLSGERPPLKLVQDSELRYISLPKLEAQLLALANQGQPIPESLRYLGGMYEIQAIAVDTEAGDLFLVGPAGPWQTNEQGVPVHVATGRPVLHLDDLVACLRNVIQGRGVLGCSIDPRPGQFQKAAELAAKWNLTVPQVRTRFLTAVGPQDTVVFGVPNWSHAAQVLLTADYHIKLLAMGTVNGGPQLPSFLERSTTADPPSEIIRWWFTLAQPEIRQSEEGNLYTIHGPVMELKTEAKFIAGRQGQAAPPRSLPAETFVADFNRQLPQVRRSFPVYGQLENLFQMAVVAQVLHSQKLPQQVNWQPGFLVGQREGQAKYDMQRYPEIREVELVINHRTLPVPRAAGGGQAQREVLVAISGGVEVNATGDNIKAALTTRSADAFSSQLRTGTADVRPFFQPVQVGPADSQATLPSTQWFADRKSAERD